MHEPAWREVTIEKGIALRLPPGIGFQQPTTPDQQWLLTVSALDIGPDAAEGKGWAEQNIVDIARATEAALKRGEYGTDDGVASSHKLLTLPNAYAKYFVILTVPGDACAIDVYPTVVIYHNYTEITLTTNGISDQLIIDERPQYLTNNSQKCPGLFIWKDGESEKAFYNELLAGTAPKDIQQRYDLFQEIIETIVVK